MPQFPVIIKHHPRTERLYAWVSAQTFEEAREIVWIVVENCAYDPAAVAQEFRAEWHRGESQFSVLDGTELLDDEKQEGE